MNYFNIIGLIIDIAGAILIFFNSPEFTHHTYIYSDEEETNLNKKEIAIRRRARIGMGMLIIGFVFQLLGNLYNC